MKLATIDIGTNSIKLLIAEFDPKTRKIEPLKEDLSLSRLGEGSQKDRILKPEAMKRTLDGLKRFHKLTHDYQVKHVFVAATMCTREALNRDEFCELISEATGWSVWVMTGEEEAHTSYMGARTLFPKMAPPIVALDIGGGSTEWISDRDGKDIQVKSLILGTVRETETFLTSQPPKEKEFDHMSTHIKKTFEKLPDTLLPRPQSQLLGIGGTVVSLSLMLQPSGDLPPIKQDELEKLIKKIKRMSVEERLFEYPKLERGRADVILAGAVILHTAMKTFKLGTCLISYRGLRYGLVPQEIE